MNIRSTYDTEVVTESQSQLITDDFVEALTEIGSFFMQEGVVAAPVDYVNDTSKNVSLDSHIVLAEIRKQQIFECQSRSSIRLSGVIIEGFARPREFNFFLSHSYPGAKVFLGRDNLQTFELSEFLRLEYPEISLVLSDSLFSLQFLDFNTNNEEPVTLFNGGGCLLLGEDSH